MTAITDRCQPLATEPLSADDAEQFADWYKVLADGTRLRLLSLIINKGSACAACDLVDVLDVSQPTVSHHLKVLHDVGLVERHKRGRWIYYEPCLDKLAILSRNLSPGPTISGAN